MKYNYMKYKDAKTGKVFNVTFVYSKNSFSFSVQSLKDNHFKLMGRYFANMAYANGKRIVFTTPITWESIKLYFELVRKNNQVIHFNTPESKKFEIPTHLKKATRLLSPKERKIKNLEWLEDLK